MVQPHHLFVERCPVASWRRALRREPEKEVSMTSHTLISRRCKSSLRAHRLAALALGFALLAAVPARADSDSAKKSADAVRSLFAAINARDLPGVMTLLADG